MMKCPICGNEVDDTKVQVGLDLIVKKVVHDFIEEIKRLE